MMARAEPGSSSSERRFSEGCCLWRRRAPEPWLWLLFTATLLLCQPRTASAISGVVTVPPYKDDCYLFVTPHSWNDDLKRNPRFAWGNFELIHKGDRRMSAGPLIVYLATYNLDRMLYRSRKGQPSGHFDVAVEGGQKYWFCIVNSQRGRHADDDDDHMMDMDDDRMPQEDDFSRTVGFTLDLVTGDEFDYTDLGGNPVVPDTVDSTTRAHREAKERAGEWHGLGSKLVQRLKDMKLHFDYLRVREAEHRSTTEKTFTDVLTWTVLEAGTVALVAVAQIMYFRRFLERQNRFTMLG